VRFDAPVAERLASLVAANPGMSLSSAANRLVDEALPVSEHPGIMFRPGPPGRRAALAGGPDVWEVLRAKGHDVMAVVADAALISLPDAQMLAHAASAGRALVTANIKDFMPLDGQYRAAGQSHAGLTLLSTKTFPQDHSLVGAIAGALAALLDSDQIRADRVVFLTRH
jgi:hypothetical protein